MSVQLGYVHTYTFSNQHRFQNTSPLSPVHTTTQRFRKSPLSNPFSKVSVSGENGDFRKRVWKWRLSKTETFENGVDLKTYTCGRGLNVLRIWSCEQAKYKSYSRSSRNCFIFPHFFIWSIISDLTVNSPYIPCVRLFYYLYCAQARRHLRLRSLGQYRICWIFVF